MNIHRTSFNVSDALKWLALAGFLGLCLSLNVAAKKEELPAVSHDGLHLQEDTGRSIIYVDPEADFSLYTKYIMLEPFVAFKKNWERDTKVAGRRVPKDHIAKIKVAAADLLEEVFREELEANDGYPLVTEPDDDVMLVRTAIVDLVVTAPDVPVAGRVEQYTSSSIAATLYLEMFDSVTGDILVRALDRQMIRDAGYAKWTNSVTNRADAKRIFKRWASWLRESWDQIHAENQEARKGF